MMAKTKHATHRRDQESEKARKRKQQFEGEDGQPSPKRKQIFSGLKAQTRHISQEMIRSEWKACPKPVRQKARDILLAAKRATLNQIADGPRRREAEISVNDVIRRLERQLPRMPFPVKTKVVQLDLDFILEHTRILEAEKIPLKDSVKLLKEEIEKEEERIEAKRDELAKLEKAAKAAEKVRNQRAKKIHPLFEDFEKPASTVDDADSIGLVNSPAHDNTFDGADEDLAPLLSQLQNHLESIQSNSHQVAILDNEMIKTRAALATVLPPQDT